MNIGEFEIPVVDAVQGYPRREEIRCAGKSEGRQVPTIRSAPDCDTRGVDIGTSAQIQAGALHVIEFACASGAEVQCFTKIASVSDAAAVVNRQDDVSLARK